MGFPHCLLLLWLGGGCYKYTFSYITMDEGEYSNWCSENIPAAANYDKDTHGRLFSR